MGWLLLLVLALATAAVLWRFVRGDRAAVQLLAAALLFAFAGYAWQGRPGLEGRPKPPPQRQQLPDSEFAESREAMLGRFDFAASWLMLAESYQRRGDTRSGVDILQSALRQAPNDPDLWVGLGNALVVHSDGLMTPAAQYAFGRAQAIAPDHPGPRYFFGLGLAQGGRYDEAERVWAELLDGAPADAPWRAMVTERLEALRADRAAGRLPQPQ